MYNRNNFGRNEHLACTPTARKSADKAGSSQREGQMVFAGPLSLKIFFRSVFIPILGEQIFS